jgi:hypothetical protein
MKNNLKHSIYTNNSRSGIVRLFKSYDYSKTFFRDTTRFTNIISVDQAEIMLEDLLECFLILEAQDYMSSRIYDRSRKSVLIRDLKNNYEHALRVYSDVRIYDKRWTIADFRMMCNTAKYMDETDCNHFDDYHFKERFETYAIVSRVARLARYCQMIARFHNIVL